MIGIDLVKISRLININALMDKILSFIERKLLLKANYLGLSDIALKKIEVLYNIKGTPIIKYCKKIYDVSIAHDGDYVIAVVNI